VNGQTTTCAAPKHGSYKAWTVGCRCHDALLARELKLVRDRKRSSALWANRPRDTGADVLPPELVRPQYVAVDPDEPDYVNVLLVVEGRMPFGHLETAADREAARLELARAA
jgi:hypothetical protein